MKIPRSMLQARWKKDPKVLTFKWWYLYQNAICQIIATSGQLSFRIVTYEHTVSLSPSSCFSDTDKILYLFNQICQHILKVRSGWFCLCERLFPKQRKILKTRLPGIFATYNDMKNLNFWFKTFPSRDIKYQCEKNMNFTIPRVYAQTHPAIRSIM